MAGKSLAHSLDPKSKTIGDLLRIFDLKTGASCRKIAHQTFNFGTAFQTYFGRSLRSVSKDFPVLRQAHLLAIATRTNVSEQVSDQLVEKGDKKVLGALVNNPGASISGQSFGLLVNKSIGDDWLSECVAVRKDIPSHHLRDLVANASSIVRQRLMKDNPEFGEFIDAALPDAARVVATKTPDSSRNYRAAERLIKSKEVTDALVHEFAKGREIEEIIVSIAKLSGLSTAEIERLIMGTWTSPVAIIFKAIGLRLSTVEAIYRARLPSGEAMRSDGIQIKAEFIAISRATAERIMRFFRIRKSAELAAQA